LSLLTEKFGPIWLLLKLVPKHTKTPTVFTGIETGSTISSIPKSGKGFGNSLLLSQDKGMLLQNCCLRKRIGFCRTAQGHCSNSWRNHKAKSTFLIVDLIHTYLGHWESRAYPPFFEKDSV